jgi:hypothetical protein
MNKDPILLLINQPESHNSVLPKISSFILALFTAAVCEQTERKM